MVGKLALRMVASALATAAFVAACSSDSADPNGDAGADASQEAAAETGPAQAEGFCFSRPALPLCEDFDEAPLPGVFATMVGEAAMAIEQGDATSKPAALRITADPANGATLDARLISAPLTAGKKLRSLVQVSLPARTPTADAAPLRLCSMEFTGERAGVAGKYRYSFATNGKGDWFGEELFAPNDGGAPESKTFPAQAGVPSDEWTSVRLEVDVLANGSATFGARVGADVVLAGVPMGTPEGLLAPVFSLGLDGAMPASAWAVRFDTVTFHFE